MTSSEATTPASGSDTFPEAGSPQDQRVWAVTRAKRVLLKGPFTGADVLDIYLLAEYILTGEDPWKPSTPEPVKSTSTTTTEVTIEVTRASA